MSEHKTTDPMAANASVETVVEPDSNVLPTKDEVKEEQPEPPPNGGTLAWLQVAGSFFLFFNCWYVLTTHRVTSKSIQFI